MQIKHAIIWFGVFLTGCQGLSAQEGISKEPGIKTMADTSFIQPDHSPSETILDPDDAEYTPSLMDTANHVFIFKEQVLGMYCVPVHGEVISKYGLRRGRMHTGTDIRLSHGDTVYAAFDGMVSRAKSYYGYGNMVVLDHHEGLQTCYAHLSKFLVKPEDVVLSGDPIGLGGRTGRATTNHLHFEVKIRGKFYNPELVFDFEGFSLRSDTLLLGPISGEHQKHKPVSGDYHIIVKGDTLYDISRKYGTTVGELCRINNINKSQVLRIGTRLRLK